MSVAASKHIEPVAELNPKTTDFIQVLVNEFRLKRTKEGCALEVRFGPDSSAVFSPAGKDALRMMIRGGPHRAAAHQEQIDAVVSGSVSTPLHFSDPEFPFRYASGGVLPIVRLGDTDYYALFWRDIFPVGWNIANGGSESVAEMLDPRHTIDREFREELVIASSGFQRLYAYPPPPGGTEEVGTLPVALALWRKRLRDGWAKPDVLQLPTKWIEGPDSIDVTYDEHENCVTSGYFLNVNAGDFGIEVDRIARMRLGEEAIFLDGELEGNRLLNQVVGLFEIEKLNDFARSGATDFRPDRLFWDGKAFDGPDLERVVREGYLVDRAGRRSRRQLAHLDAQTNWFDLCPVTRQIVLRYLDWEEHVSAVTPLPDRGRRYEVFLCFKQEDGTLARETYDYLTGRGLSVFFSAESIEITGQDDYSDAIDKALVQAHTLVVVGSDPEHISDPWPRYEWRAFHNDIRSGIKRGGRIFPLITFEPRSLPIALRTREATVYDKADPEGALNRVYRLITASQAA